MGRILEGGSVNAGTEAAKSVFNLVAGEDVSANSLILTAEDGRAYKANPLLSLSQLNNNTAGAATLSAPATLENAPAYSISKPTMRNIIAFPTGEVVYAYTGNGATDTTGVQFSIRNVTGGAAKAKVVVSTDASVATVGVERLTGDRFVIWWVATNAVNFAVYDRHGALLAAETIGPAVSSSQRFNTLCRALANGDFVFFHQASDGSARFTRYNESGVVQGSVVTVEAGDVQPVAANIIALAAGGFVCHYYRSIAPGAWKLARFNSSGAIQGAVVSAPNSYMQSGSFSNYDQTGIELSTLGSIAIMRRSVEASNPWYVDIYDASNALKRSINIQPLGNNPDQIGAITKTPDGFATILSGQYCRRFNEEGGQIGPEISVSALSGQNYSNAASYSSCWFEATPSGFAILRQADNKTTRALLFAVLAPDFTVRGGPINIIAGGPTEFSGPCMAMVGTVAVIGFREGTNLAPSICAFLTSRTSIFGVAQTAASKGSPAIVATQGSYPVSGVFASGGSFDARTNTAPGNRGTVAGSYALLLGTSI